MKSAHLYGETIRSNNEKIMMLAATRHRIYSVELYSIRSKLNNWRTLSENIDDTSKTECPMRSACNNRVGEQHGVSFV